MTGEVKQEVKDLKCRDLQNMVTRLYFSPKIRGSPSAYVKYHRTGYGVESRWR